MLINKEIVKECQLRPCHRLAWILSNEKAAVRLFKILAENSVAYDEISGDLQDNASLDMLYEYLRMHPELEKEIHEYIENNANELDLFIEAMKDYQEVSRLSMRYMESLYSGQVRRADCIGDPLDGTPILVQKRIEENTISLLNDPQVKVILEGQITKDNLYLARWDILIKEDHQVHLVEVKGSNSVLKRPNGLLKNEFETDLLFQYFVYKEELEKLGFHLASVSFLHLNKDFQFFNQTETYPLPDEYLANYFIRTSVIQVKEGFDVKPIKLIDYVEQKLPKFKISLKQIVQGAMMDEAEESSMAYHCKSKGGCLFFDECHTRCAFPAENSIFDLTNNAAVGGYYKNTKKLVEEYQIKAIADIPNDFVEENYPKELEKGSRSLARMQIEASKNPAFNEFQDLDQLRSLLQKDYQVFPLIFFDFETFNYPVPLVNQERPYEQICCQYSMHVMQEKHDVREHNFDAGVGGGITHYEFIGKPRIDLTTNPEVHLIETLLRQFEQENIDTTKGQFTLITYNKTFEQGRFHNMALKYPQYQDFLLLCESRCVDLMDFYTRGYWYRKDFMGRTSLKVTSPSFKNDQVVQHYYKNAAFHLERTLNYKSEDNVVHNGSEALEIYQSLLRASLSDNMQDALHDQTLKGLLYYCKKDSWGTVVLYDIIDQTVQGRLDFAKIVQ